MDNNWTAQLLALEVGAEKDFSSKFYNNILAVRTNLENRELGNWQTKKQTGAKTFTVRRTR